MRVLVTGAAGYLGQEVVRALVAACHEPVAMVRPGGAEVTEAGETRYADLLDPVALRQAVAGIDVVCHLAGLARARESLVNPLPFFRVNTEGTLGLLEAMAAADVARIVFASTGAIYGTPERQPMGEELPDAPPHPYASSKLAAEFAIEAQAGAGAIGAVVVRLLNVAGGQDPDPTRLIPRTLAAAAEQSPLRINGDGTAVRDYLHVKDAAEAFVACVEGVPDRGLSTRYNIGSGRGTSILDVIEAVQRVTGRQVPIAHGPAAAEPAALISDPSKARAELGWSPTRSRIDDIIREMAAD